MNNNHLNEVVVTAPHRHTPVCWSAILIGALVAVGLGFLLNLYGVAIGLSAYSSANGAQAVAIGGFIGMIIAVIASMMAAGYATGYLVRGFCCNNQLGILYGFATWCAALVLSALLVTPATNYVSAYTHSLSRTKIATPVENITTEKAGMIHQNAVATTAVPPKSEAAEDLACSAWMVFALFFIGAIASCAGASWGIGCHKKEHVAL